MLNLECYKLAVNKNGKFEAFTPKKYRFFLKFFGIIMDLFTMFMGKYLYLKFEDF